MRKATPGALRRVLVPVDFAAASDRVLGRLVLLPFDRGARVTLLHVVPDSLPPADRRLAARDAESALATEARDLRRLLPRGVRVDTRVDAGRVAVRIASNAKQLKAELIVMGRGGRTPVRDVFFGSTAERVIRASGRAVLVVRLAARGSYRRPALALELDEAADDIVRLMLRVIPPPRPRGTVVHAVEEPYQGYTYPSLSLPERVEQTTQRESRALKRLRAIVTEAFEHANVPPEEIPEWDPHLVHGPARAVVPKAVDVARADIFVVGTHGRTGLSHVVLGSVAGDLLRAVKCDVLVVPPTPSRKRK